MKNIKQRIKENYQDLTQRLKAVANFMIENPKVIALSPAKEIGNLTGTSETTVIRCCHALGYSGYSALQEDIRKSLLLPEEDEDLFKALAAGMKADKNDISQFMEKDIEHIRKTYEQLDRAVFMEAVNSIIAAEKMVVIGLRTSYAPANWLGYSLNIIKGDVTVFKGDIDDANYLMTQIDEKWLVIALSFRRYTQQTYSFVKAAKEKGARVLTLTDDELSPVGLLSNITIKAITPNPTSLRGMPTIFSILNAIVSCVMVMDSQNVERKLDEYNQSSEYYYSFSYRQHDFDD
ncbi:MurR/RpiR family transcriptional regulator [Pseudoneobacillus sp. C159]